MNEPIAVKVGDELLFFEADHDDLNDYLNAQMPNDKIGPAWNFLIRTVTPASKELLKTVALSASGKPKGIIVLQIVAVITQELGGDIEVRLKKPTAQPDESKTTAGTSS